MVERGFTQKVSVALLLFFLISILVFPQQLKKWGYYSLLAVIIPDSEVEYIESLEVRDSYCLLDTRSLEEYKVSHLKNSKHIGFPVSENVSLGFSKEDTVVVYCSVGWRSAKVAENLKQEGYLHVYNLYGGIFEWKAQGLPLFIEGKQTELVHPYNDFWAFWVRD